MPTIITHAALPLAAGIGLGRGRIPTALIAAGMALAVLPDLDVIGFRLGVDYADAWGHRGATHSLVAALLVGGVAAALMKARPRWIAFAFLAASMASHGLLDMLTNGGLGVALFWPLDLGRHFFAATPIRVSPIGAGFFSARGWAVIQSELVWIWTAAFSLGGLGYVFRKALRRA